MTTTVEAGLSPMELKTKHHKEFFPELLKEKQKLTMIVCGGGMMGADSRMTIVTRGEVLSGKGGVVLAYSEPRGRKVFSMERILVKGVVFLRGEVDKRELPLFEGDVPDANGVTRFIMDGTGGRFTDWAGDGGQSILDGLESRLVLHTLTATNPLTLRARRVDDRVEGKVIDGQFQYALLRALGAPRDTGWIELPDRPAALPTKEVFTEKLVNELKSKRGKEDFPVARLFTTSGVGTWLIYSMDEDEETIWGIGDVGEGSVSYGTLSRTELTDYRDKFGFGVERDKFWRGTTKTISQICEMTTIQTGV